MLTQLQLLEQTVSELKARYNITATELANLKHKLAHDDSPNQISQLQLKISQIKDENSSLHARVKELLSAQDELGQDNERLTKENNELNQKNALAISRAEVIQTWLSKIDNQNY